MSTKIKGMILASAMAALVSPAGAYDIRLDISGELTSSTCVVDVTNAQKTVTLPTLDVSALQVAGTFAGRQQVTIDINSCQDTTKATVNFESSAQNITSAGTLANIAQTDPASNVEVQLLDDNENALNLLTDRPEYDIANDAGTIVLYAQYHTANGGATAGKVESFVEMSMSYR